MQACHVRKTRKARKHTRMQTRHLTKYKCMHSQFKIFKIKKEVNLAITRAFFYFFSGKRASELCSSHINKKTKIIFWCSSGFFNNR